VLNSFLWPGSDDDVVILNPGSFLGGNGSISGGTIINAGNISVTSGNFSVQRFTQGENGIIEIHILTNGSQSLNRPSNPSPCELNPDALLLVHSDNATLNGTLTLTFDDDYVRELLYGSTNLTKVIMTFGNVTGSFNTINLSPNVQTTPNQCGCGYFTTTQSQTSLSLLFNACPENSECTPPPPIAPDSPLRNPDGSIAPTDGSLNPDGLSAPAQAGIAVAVIVVVVVVAMVVVWKVPAIRSRVQPFLQRGSKQDKLEMVNKPQLGWEGDNSDKEWKMEKTNLTITNT